MCGTFWLTTKSAKFTKRLDFSDFFTFHFLCLIVLRDLRITIVQSLRSLRKFSGHCSYVAVLNEKIRPHHEVHKGFRIFQTPNFVIFVSFVVNIFLPIWLRRSRARCFVVNTSPSKLCAFAHFPADIASSAVRGDNPRRDLLVERLFD